MSMEKEKKFIETHSAQETWEAGRSLGQTVVPGQVIALVGDLGTGKTVFSQGFAAGLQIDDQVNSPTFTILQVYDSGRLPLYHFDVYRIGDIEEMDEIGYEDYFFGEGVTVIEWSDLISELIPENAVKVLIEKSAGDDDRRITVTELDHEDSRY